MACIKEIKLEPENVKEFICSKFHAQQRKFMTDMPRLHNNREYAQAFESLESKSSKSGHMSIFTVKKI